MSVDETLEAYVRPCTREPEPFDETLEVAHTVQYKMALLRAREICRSCLASDECLADNADAPGVIAGYTRQQRAHFDSVPLECGTPAAYWRHRRRGEPTCTPCSAAYSAQVVHRRRVREATPR